MVAVLLAAGKGLRMGVGIPKQELVLNGKEIFFITAERFAAFRCVDAILFVTPAGRSGPYRERLAGLPKLFGVIEGGAERHDSVWNALEYLQEGHGDSVLLMHDVVRPFVSEVVVAEVARVAQEQGAAVAAARAVDTLYEVDGGEVLRIPDRSLMWHAQTPQGFRYGLLRRAHEHFRERGGTTTDDVRLVLALGERVSVVESGLDNFKITVPVDLSFAEALYRQGRIG